MSFKLSALVRTTALRPMTHLVQTRLLPGNLMGSATKTSTFVQSRKLSNFNNTANKEIKFPKEKQLLKHLMDHPFLQDPEDSISIHKSMAEAFSGQEKSPAEIRSLVVHKLHALCEANKIVMSEREFMNLAINFTEALTAYPQRASESTKKQCQFCDSIKQAETWLPHCP